MRGIVRWLAIAALAAVALAPAARAAAPELEKLLSMQAVGELDIDATGKVSAWRIATPLPAAVRANIDRSIPAWRFTAAEEGAALEPLTVDMTLALRAEPADGAYRVTIENVRFAEKKADNALRKARTSITPTKLVPPEFPPVMGEFQVDCIVLVALLLDAEGRVVQAEVLQSALYDAKGEAANLRKALEHFERSALAGARRWRFDVSASDGPLTADELTVHVPINYAWDRRRGIQGKWRALTRTPLRSPTWKILADDRLRYGVADVSGGGMVPAPAPVRLVSPPGEQAL